MRFTIADVLAAATLFSGAYSAPTIGSKLKVVKTTTTAKGQIIDWILPESQGEVASPPTSPPSKIKPGPFEIQNALDFIPKDIAHQGPAGTVPILRASDKTMAPKKLPSPEANNTAQADSNAGKHWYASSAQSVNNNGGQATVSLFDAFVESPTDFSLIQTAVVYNLNGKEQTVETGWINYPNQVAEPHLFSFYTTNAYTASGDNIGGWNRDQAGWVQVDANLYPGIPFSPMSTDGGDQFEMQIGYQLKDGNWWLWCVDRYIGYYPASLFGDAGSSLAGGATQIAWYGEIFNSGDDLTTTDMGSGEFPSTGFGKSAYLHNIVYYDQSLNSHNFDGSSGMLVSDTTRYDIIPTWNSADSWASYFYLGGPGNGGKIGS